MTILQSTPNSDYIDWLAERLGEEKPFIGYHACVALLSAVRTLDASHAQELRTAIAAAKKGLLASGVTKSTDRFVVLDEAEHELNLLSKTTDK